MSNALPSHLSTLLSAAAYPHPASQIRLIETHISWVLLAGEFAYKIKRPVRYPFADMRSPQRRHFLCEEEIRLNRRFAPDLYLDVVPVTLDAGQARMGGTGEPVEHAVRMRRFDRSEELARLVAEARVAPEELAAFGRSFAHIHEQLPSVEAANPCGTVASVRNSLLENLAQYEKLSERAGATSGVGTLSALIRALLESDALIIEARRGAGRVRECHGDLHCRNVVRHAGRLVAFDCLEFEPRFRWIDVAEEIAFLFMDLCRHGADVHAGAFLNGYFAQGGDFEAARLVRLYGAHRALVRAKVAAIEASTNEPSTERQQALEAHEAYVSCARRLLEEKHPSLILMSGLSGSGKTWLAERVASAIRGIHVRSDVERKRLAALAELSPSRSAVGTGLYTADMNVRTYQRLAECAANTLAGGFNTVVDATFLRRQDRARFARLANAFQAPIVMVQCRAPDAVLRSRIVERSRKGGDASEADLAVLERQRALCETIDPGEELPLISVDTTRSTALHDVITSMAPLVTA